MHPIGAVLFFLNTCKIKIQVIEIMGMQLLFFLSEWHNLC